MYYHGCRCGKLGNLIRDVQSYADRNAIEFEAKNSKYDDDVAFDHLNWLRLSNLSTDSYQAIVVRGNSVQLLSGWSY